MVHRLDRMTWPTVKERLNDGSRLVVVIAGSIEQHGPGLPLGVDTIRADELGERIAAELDCFLAPTIRPGISDHHMSFPGTITLTPETFRDVARDYCRSLAAHGFDHVAFITTHGGNTETLESVTSELDDDLDAQVFLAGDREEFLHVRYRAMAEHDIPPEAAGLHAGAAEASFIRATHPEFVDGEAMERGHVGDVDATAVQEQGVAAVSANGVLGDQTQSGREAGATLIDDCVAYFADVIRAELASDDR